MVFEPDPLRDHFTRGARQLLDRAYKASGPGWTGTLLADPNPRALAACLVAGIDPFGPDNASSRSGRAGGLNARSRWMRAFVRCLYEQHLWWADSHVRPGEWRTERRMVPLRTRGLLVEVGFAKPAVGLVPRGRAIRIRAVGGGYSAATRKPYRDRIYTDSGATADRWSDPALRDWQ